jgi:tetratricopeptide (TPR) repeat protein
MSRKRRKRRGKTEKGPASIRPRAPEVIPRGLVALALLAPAAVSLLLFAVTVTGPFLYDDAYYVVDHVAIRELGNVPGLWLSRFPAQLDVGIYRPLTATSYAIDHAIAGLSPFVFHLHNVLLHAATSLLVALLLLRLGMSAVVSALGGLLFAAHPVHTEAVAWVTGRSELLAALFCLLATLAWIRFRRSERARWLLLAAATYGLALAAKEIAVSLPAALLVGDYYSLFGRAGGGERVSTRFAWLAERSAGMSERRRTLPRDGLLPYAAFAGVLLLYLGLRGAILGALTNSPELLAFTGDPPSTRLFTAVAGLWRYARLLVLPIDLRVIYEAKQAALSGPVLLGLLVASGAAVWVWLSRARSPWPAFWIAWLVVFLLVVSNLIIEIGAVAAERFLYLPSVGFCSLVAVLAGRGLSATHPRRRTGTIAAATAVLVAFSVATIGRNLDWTDEVRFWRRAHAQAPGSVKATENLAAVLTARAKATGDQTFAVEAIEVRKQGVAVQVTPTARVTEDHVRTLSQLVRQLRAAKRYEEALAEHEKLTPLLLRYGQLRMQTRLDGIVAHAETLEALGRYDEALAIYEQAGQAIPMQATLALGIGNTLKKERRLDEAIGRYREAVELDPSFGLAYVNLASALIDTGQTDASLDAVAGALRKGETEHALGVLEYIASVIDRGAGGAPSGESLARVAQQLDARLGGSGDPRVARLRGWLERQGAGVGP